MTGLFTVPQDLSMRKMVLRMERAARLKRESFEQLRDDPTAMVQALLVIPIVGICYGAGFALLGYFDAGFSTFQVLTVTLVGLLGSFIIAFIWSGTTFLVVTKLFHQPITYARLARPFLFAWSPGIIFILTLTPILVLSDLARAIGTAWMIIASVYAVKHSVGFSTQNSLLTFIISAVILLPIQLLIPILVG